MSIGYSVGHIKPTKGNTITGFVWDGKEEHKLGENCVPIAISNNSKYIYFYKIDNGEDILFVQTGFDENKRENLGKNFILHMGNYDLSQVIVQRVAGDFYISVNGGKRLIPIVSDFIFPYKLTPNYNHSAQLITSFADTFYLNMNKRDSKCSIVRINKNLKTEIIAEDVTSAFLANDGRTLIYHKDGSIYKIDGLADKIKETELVKDNANGDFIMTADGSGIYYTNDKDDLFYQKGNSKPVKIAAKITTSAKTLFNGDTLFYIGVDGKHYSTKDGKVTKIDSIDGDIEEVAIEMFEVFLAAIDDSGQVIIYRSTDGKKFDTFITVT